jgi:tol-pal system protein YbgF
MNKPALLTASLLAGGLFAYSALAEVPVVDRSGDPAPAAPAKVKPVPVQTGPNPVAPGTAVGAAPMQPISATAELLMMLEQLQEEVGYLRGQLEQQQHQLKQMKQDQRDRYRDLDRRLSLLNRPVTAPAPAATVLPAALPDTASAASATAPAPSAPAAVTTAPMMTDAQAYKQAFSLVRTREFELALQAFNQFLTSYPNSPLRANVYYWSGEVNRAKAEPELVKAAEAYQQVVNRYPSHSKAADAHYKLGITQQEQGLNEQAKATMAEVMALYPNQAAAKLAQDFLNQHR